MKSLYIKSLIGTYELTVKHGLDLNGNKSIKYWYGQSSSGSKSFEMPFDNFDDLDWLKVDEEKFEAKLSEAVNMFHDNLEQIAKSMIRKAGCTIPEKQSLRTLSDFKSSYFHKSYQSEYRFKDKIESFDNTITDVYLHGHPSFVRKDKGITSEVKFLEHQSDIYIKFYTSCNISPNMTIDDFEKKQRDQSDNRDETIKIASHIFEEWLGRKPKNIKISGEK